MNGAVPVDPGSLVEAIRGPSPRYKRAEVDAIVAHQRETTPFLLAILDRVLADPEAYAARAGDEFEVPYALVLLSHFREVGAHERIVRLASLRLDLADAVFDFFIDEGLDASLLATCGGDVRHIRGLVSNRAASSLARMNAVVALALAVHRGWADRDEVLAFLASQLVPDAAEPDSFFWVSVSDAMLALHATEYAELLHRVCDEGLLEAGEVDHGDIADILDASPAAGELVLRDWTRRTDKPGVHDWLPGWERFSPRPASFDAAWPPRVPADRERKRSRKRQKDARKKQRRQKKR